MRFRRLDLNLLVALDALLSLKSVTAAAARLHVTQPTMSASLGRLRDHFSDPLLVQVGRRMELTPLGELLLDPLRDALDRVEATVELRPEFSPATSRRHFTLCASDGTTSMLLSTVVDRAYRMAPSVTVELLPPDPYIVPLLARREIDFVFSGEHDLLPGHPTALAMSDTFACIAWKGNPAIKRTLTVDQFTTLGHVVTRFGRDKRPSAEHYALADAGIQRRIEVSCGTPILLGSLIVGTSRIATLPARLAAPQAAALPLRVFKPPMNLPPLRIYMQWNRVRQQDVGTIWMRDLVLSTAKEIGLIGPVPEAAGVFRL